MKISELKKEAKIKLSGKMKKAFSIYLIYMFLTIILFVLLFNILTKLSLSVDTQTTLTIIQDLIAIVCIPFSFGILASMIRLSRNDDVKVFDFLKIGIQNIGKIFKIYIVMIIKLWKPILLYCIAYLFVILFQNNYLVGTIPILASLILAIVSIVMFIQKSLSYSLALYIFHDNPEDKPGNILDKSEKIMNGYRLKIVLLDLSFIGWIFVIALVTILAVFLSIVPIIASINNVLGLVNTNIHSLALVIGVVLLLPYMSFTKINFYEELISNEK